MSALEVKEAGHSRLQQDRAETRDELVRLREGVRRVAHGTRVSTAAEFRRETAQHKAAVDVSLQEEVMRLERLYATRHEDSLKDFEERSAKLREDVNTFSTVAQDTLGKVVAVEALTSRLLFATAILGAKPFRYSFFWKPVQRRLGQLSRGKIEGGDPAHWPAIALDFGTQLLGLLGSSVPRGVP